MEMWGAGHSSKEAMTRFLLACLLFSLPACGGHVILAAADSGEPSSGNGSSPSSDDGGAGEPSSPPGSPFPVCPGSQPKAGWSCPNANQGCAYVDLQAGTCVSWTCNSAHQWEPSTPAGC